MRYLRLFVALVAVAGSFVLSGAIPASAGESVRLSPIVRVDSGVLRGRVSAHHRSFSGIPYAAPPVGARRWRPPAQSAPWDSPRDAMQPGPVCPQLGGPTGSTVVGDEDCLYLNVTTPVHGDGRPRPVLGWLPGRQVAQTRGRQAAQDLGCDTPATEADCLRAISAARLVTLGADHMPISADRLADLPWLPVADMSVLPRQPLDALRRGSSARVPMLTGTTRDDMRPFVALEHDARGRPVTVADYPELLAAQFGPRADAIRAHYPAASYPSPGIALAAVLTDWGHMLGACPVLPATRAVAEHAPVYAYEFAEDSGASIAGFPLGTPHGAELPYLFDGAFDGPGDVPLTAPQRHLSEQLIRYWSNFAASGDPNGAGLPAWPRYRGDGGLVLSMTAGSIEATDFGKAHQCGFRNGSA